MVHISHCTNVAASASSSFRRRMPAMLWLGHVELIAAFAQGPQQGRWMVRTSSIGARLFTNVLTPRARSCLRLARDGS